MQVPATVGAIARQVVDSRISGRQRPVRLAVAGFWANSDIDGLDPLSPLALAPLTEEEAVVRTREALDRAVVAGERSLASAGFTVVPLAETRQTLAVAPLPLRGSPPLVPARGLPVLIGVDAFVGSAVTWDNCQPADLAPLFSGLQVDGLLVAAFRRREGQLGQAGLVLVTRASDGALRIG